MTIKTFFASLILLAAFLAILLSPWSQVSAYTVTFASWWAFFYFTHVFYVLFLFSALFYVLANVPSYSLANNLSSNAVFSSVEGLDLVKLLVSPLLALFILHSSWTGPVLTAWFGHIIFSTFQFKITYVLFFFFTTYLVALLTNTHFSSIALSDFIILTINFFVWTWLLFFSNNLFTFIFFLEVISALVTLLLITSAFSSTYFYNNLSYASHTYFQNSTPTALLNTIMTFFWITLVSSLMLFLSLLIFYFKYLTFDWSLAPAIFLHLFTLSSLKSVFSLSLGWLLLIICLLIKCGVVPFYLWKPTFFKGMSMLSLFFYVYFYYFSMFLYFLYVLTAYLNEMFAFNIFILSTVVIIATVGITSILFESYYVKSFLALSSILNSILLLFAICSFSASDFLFIL